MSKRSRCRPGHHDSTNEARRRRARVRRRCELREQRYELREREMEAARVAYFNYMNVLRGLCGSSVDYTCHFNPKSIIKRPDPV
jgi:hypothetical protein